MSGIYDIKRFTGGYYDASVYFNNPVDFLANEHDPSRLEEMRKIDIILAVGRDDPLVSIDGTTNAVVVEAEPVGRVTVTGPGAGPQLAGQGVLSDLIAVAGLRARSR